MNKSCEDLVSIVRMVSVDFGPRVCDSQMFSLIHAFSAYNDSGAPTRARSSLEYFVSSIKRLRESLV